MPPPPTATVPQSPQEPERSAKELFLDALELGDPRDRDAFLVRGARGDAVVLAKARALLRAHERAGRFLDDPLRGVSAGEAPRSIPSSEGPGTKLGPYTLLDPIGEGGFGRVYLAEQERPIKRRVALKIIKLGMDTRAVVARFEQERQALAMRSRRFWTRGRPSREGRTS